MKHQEVTAAALTMFPTKARFPYTVPLISAVLMFSTPAFLTVFLTVDSLKFETQSASSKPSQFHSPLIAVHRVLNDNETLQLICFPKRKKPLIPSEDDA
jgi:hypothetical protein